MPELMFNVRTAKVWPLNTNTNTYGTGVTLDARGFSGDPQYDTDETKSGGAVEDTLAVLTSIDGMIRLRGIDWAPTAVMIGTDDTSSGSDTHINDESGGEDAPYFGLAMAIRMKNGTEKHVYYPKCQIQSGIDIDLAEDSEFVDPDIDFKAMRLNVDGTKYPVRKSFTKSTETALADIAGVIGLS